MLLFALTGCETTGKSCCGTCQDKAQCDKAKCGSDQCPAAKCDEKCCGTCGGKAKCDKK